MPYIATIIILAVFGYLLGAVPFGLFIGKKIKGIDVRNFGSGNIGATNVVRVVGRNWGILVFVLDFLKGFLPVLTTFLVLGQDHDFLHLSLIIVVLATISGHNWPVYLRFKGGKGVSTSIGCAVALSLFLSFLRIPVAVTIGVWVVVFYLSHLVGLASLLSAFSFLLSCFLMPQVTQEFRYLSILIALFITVRHRQNIKDIYAHFAGKRGQATFSKKSDYMKK